MLKVAVRMRFELRISSMLDQTLDTTPWSGSAFVRIEMEQFRNLNETYETNKFRFWSFTLNEIVKNSIAIKTKITKCHKISTNMKYKKNTETKNYFSPNFSFSMMT